MSLASRMASTALKLLTAYGQSVSVARGAGTFIPSTGMMGSTSTTSYSGYGYPTTYKAIEIDGQTIRQDDTLLIFSSTTRPQINDVFTVGAKVFTALGVQLITVSGSDVVYKVQLRQ